MATVLDAWNDRVRPLMRVEYDRLVEDGAFANERLELIHGRLIRMSPQGYRHSLVLERLSRWLTRAADDSTRIRTQMPFALDDDSEPEPDLVVTREAASEAHPSTAILIVEVSDSSIRFDTDVKLPLYARARVPEVWIVDVAEETIEVHTEPRGSAYANHRTVTRDGLLQAGALGDIRISDLFA